jgi:hypothetical protein
MPTTIPRHQDDELGVCIVDDLSDEIATVLSIDKMEVLELFANGE